MFCGTWLKGRESVKVPDDGDERFDRVCEVRELIDGGGILDEIFWSVV